MSESGPKPTAALEERTYRFISDPRHKENLSGRVRAACLTCRRKKIKCSGELNCNTCREKGLICEGLPERKRHSRDTGSSLLAPVHASRIERKRKTSPPKKSSANPHSAGSVLAYENVESNDSGNATDSTLSPASSAPHADPIAESASANILLRDSRALHNTGLDVHTWQLDANPLGRDETEPLTAASTQFASDLSPIEQVFSANAIRSPIDWSHAEDDGWWARQTSGGAQDLAAPVPHAIAQEKPLQVPINRQPANIPHDITRRQTIAFPLPSPDTTAPQYDILQNRTKTRAESTHVRNADNVPEYGGLDDLALLLTNRTPGTGLTPHLPEFSCWWDIANLDFAQAHHNLHMVAPVEADAGGTRNTSSLPHEQQQATQPNTATDYFGPLWPD